MTKVQEYRITREQEYTITRLKYLQFQENKSEIVHVIWWGSGKLESTIVLIQTRQREDSY